MLTLFQAIVMGALQGIAELFPISSLGHSVIFPQLVGWNVDQSNPDFLAFLVATHLATALVLLGFFWRDWLNIVSGVLLSLKNRVIRDDDVYGRLGWLLVVSTIPAGILGLLFEDTLKHLFATPKIAAFFLFLNGILLFCAEYLKRKAPGRSDGDAALSHITWLQAIGIGCMQCIALLPGFSRTGATLSGGLAVGLSHENAARYSFLLATPIILAAAILKMPELFSSASTEVISVTFFGALCSAVSAYFSVKFLLKYFETKKLTPFAAYCLIAGAITYLLLH